MDYESKKNEYDDNLLNNHYTQSVTSVMDQQHVVVIRGFADKKQRLKTDSKKEVYKWLFDITGESEYLTSQLLLDLPNRIIIVGNREKAEEVVQVLRLENYEASIETMDTWNAIERKKNYIRDRLKSESERVSKSYHNHKLSVIFRTVSGCAFGLSFIVFSINFIGRTFVLLWGMLSVFFLALFVLSFAVGRSIYLEIKRLERDIYCLENSSYDSVFYTLPTPQTEPKCYRLS